MSKQKPCPRPLYTSYILHRHSDDHSIDNGKQPSNQLTSAAPVQLLQSKNPPDRTNIHNGLLPRPVHPIEPTLDGIDPTMLEVHSKLSYRRSTARPTTPSGPSQSKHLLKDWSKPPLNPPKIPSSPPMSTRLEDIPSDLAQDGDESNRHKTPLSLGTRRRGKIPTN